MASTDTATKSLFDKLAEAVPTPPATDDMTALRAEMSETNAAVAALTEAVTQVVGMVTAPAPPDKASASPAPPKVDQSGKAAAARSKAAERPARVRRPKAGVQTSGPDGVTAEQVAAFLAANNLAIAQPEADPNPPHNVTTTRKGSTLLIAVDLDADVVATEHNAKGYGYIATSGGNMKARLDLEEVTGIPGATMMLRISKPIS